MSELNFVADQNIFLRHATLVDLPVLAHIHKQAYSRNHFTALLSNEALIKYYGYFLNEGSEILLALNKDSSGIESVLGFAVYGRGIPEQIKRFKRAAFKDILMTSLRYPINALHKLAIAFWIKVRPRSERAPANFLLLSIAVRDRGFGIGGFLLKAMLINAQKNNENIIGLYVNANNLSAINAYFSTGFILKYYQNDQYYMEVYLD